MSLFDLIRYPLTTPTDEEFDNLPEDIRLVVLNSVHKHADAEARFGLCAIVVRIMLKQPVNKPKADAIMCDIRKALYER